MSSDLAFNLPPILPPGGTIGVVATSSPVEPARFERGLGVLQGAGFQVVLGDHVHARRGHHAGTPEERAADLNAMFAREDVHAIMCARGGTGSIRLLDLLDYEAIEQRPKVFIGYSDVTSLQLALLARSRLPSFFGPMVQPEFGAGSTDGLPPLLRLVGNATPAGELVDPRLPDRATTLVEGAAEGPCIGGTLTLVAASIGTPYQPDFSGAVLFFEDVGENPGRIERYLTQLKWAGVLDLAAGFLIGDARWDVASEERGRFLALEEVYTDLLGPLGKPAMFGFPFGHLPSPLTLPQGIRVRLDSGRRCVTVLEPGVRLLDGG